MVAAYWAAAEARDWHASGALLADDVIYRSPQTREQVRGRDAYIRFNVEGFPYDWHITVQRIVGEHLQAASWIEFTGPKGTQPGLCFSDLGDDSRITHHRRVRPWLGSVRFDRRFPQHREADDPIGEVER